MPLPLKGGASEEGYVLLRSLC